MHLAGQFLGLVQVLLGQIDPRALKLAQAFRRWMIGTEVKFSSFDVESRKLLDMIFERS